MNYPPLPPVPNPMSARIAQRLADLFDDRVNELAPVILCETNYRALFAGLEAPGLLDGPGFDQAVLKSLRVLRIGESVPDRPKSMTSEVADELGTLAASAGEILAKIALSAWYALFATSARLGARLLDKYRSKLPEFHRDPAQQLTDLLINMAADRPTVILVDSVDSTPRDLIFDLVRYVYMHHGDHRMMVMCGTDRPLPDVKEDDRESLSYRVELATSHGEIERLRIPRIDRGRLQTWLGAVDDEVVEALIGPAGGDDFALSAEFGQWVERGFVQQRDGAWTLTCEGNPIRERITRVVTARLSSNDRNRRLLHLADDALSFAAVGGPSFNLTAVARATADYMGCTEDDIVDVLDELVPTAQGDPWLLVEDGFVSDQASGETATGETLWRYRFADPSVARYLRNADSPSTCPVDMIAGWLLEESNRCGFPPLFDSFHHYVALAAGRADLAAQFKERHDYELRRSAQLDRAHVIAATHSGIDYPTESILDLAWHLIVDEYDNLAGQIARIAYDQAQSTTESTQTRALAARLRGMSQRRSNAPAGTILLREALTLYEQLHNTDPTNHDYTHDLAATLGDLAWTVRDRNPEDATRLYEQALTLREQLNDTDPTNQAYTNGLAVTLGGLARAVRDRNPEHATRLYEQALTLREQLNDTDPTNHAYTRDLASTLEEFASTVRDPEHATRLYEHALTLYEQLHDTDPTNYDYTHGLAITLSEFARTVRDRDPVNATTLNETALTLYEQLHNTDPTNHDYTHGLAATLGGLAWTVRDCDPEHATRLYEQALTLREQLNDTDPTNQAPTNGLAVTLGGLARAVRDRDPEHATRLYETARTLHEQLHKTDPTNHAYTHGLAATLRDLAWTVRDRDPEHATTLYETALTLSEQLHKTDPTNHTYTHGLANTLGGLAWTVRDSDPEHATTLYETALTLLEQLHNTDPTNNRYRNDLRTTLRLFADHNEPSDAVRAALLRAQADQLET